MSRGTAQRPLTRSTLKPPHRVFEPTTGESALQRNAPAAGVRMEISMTRAKSTRLLQDGRQVAIVAVGAPRADGETPAEHLGTWELQAE
jgi:hypothetical protein